MYGLTSHHKASYALVSPTSVTIAPPLPPRFVMNGALALIEPWVRGGGIVCATPLYPICCFLGCIRA